jgi:hypothetical protein
MSDLMYYDDPLVSEDFVNDSVVSGSKFVHTSQIARQSLGINIIQILRKPANSIDNSMRNSSI